MQGQYGTGTRKGSQFRADVRNRCSQGCSDTYVCAVRSQGRIDDILLVQHSPAASTIYAAKHTHEARELGAVLGSDQLPAPFDTAAPAGAGPL